MELTKTEVFECTKCGALSKDSNEIKKCLQAHRKKELKEEGEREFFQLQNKLNLIMVNNLSSFHPDAVKNNLIEAARIVGYNLTINNNIVGPRFSSGYGNQTYASYSINGSFKKEGSSEFEGIKIPSAASHYLQDLLSKKFVSYVGDLIRCIKGLDTGGGGGGKDGFTYEIRVYLSAFPVLKEKYDEYLLLEEARKKYVDRSNILKKEYTVNRIPQLLYSDIPYMEKKLEYDEILLKMEELREKSSLISSKMEARKAELIKKDSPRFATPETSFDYDEARLNELRSALGV